ncbi:uncharacterized protein MYCFIDRAFT_180692 [Pseudocercospora fijiensis CIRAD86]|uniref:Uncharacterized protein n=1 Tax=Pseudocercospora fijiensis (strain CIRAD86) TaxID=383855 RepID=M2ZCG7_PSEFD|nr:uncharacterized protein MYCFIDRAFT_180692 [Pseudocercospora fijiensis CIRAD86]EME76789.1 hypothetical protein MYCFIDRAFT_180692 [Pseudocercospora fijiensis CIRAD86]
MPQCSVRHASIRSYFASPTPPPSIPLLTSNRISVDGQCPTMRAVVACMPHCLLVFVQRWDSANVGAWRAGILSSETFQVIRTSSLSTQHGIHPPHTHNHGFCSTHNLMIFHPISSGTHTLLIPDRFLGRPGTHAPDWLRIIDFGQQPSPCFIAGPDPGHLSRSRVPILIDVPAATFPENLLTLALRPLKKSWTVWDWRRTEHSDPVQELSNRNRLTMLPPTHDWSSRLDTDGTERPCRPLISSALRSACMRPAMLLIVFHSTSRVCIKQAEGLIVRMSWKRCGLPEWS